MARKPYTGGPLNVLNGKAGISAPQNSVSVSALVRAHKPKSAAELESLISDHTAGNCECGIVSKGSVQNFGKNLFNAQESYWGECRFTLQECVQWEYDLFVLQMLKGTMMEDKCKSALAKLLPAEYAIQDTNAFIDEDLRVDLQVMKNGKTVAGIQVKPLSYDKIRSEVKYFNRKANSKFQAPVYYVAYEYDTEAFTNLKEVASEIAEN